MSNKFKLINKFILLLRVSLESKKLRKSKMPLIWNLNINFYPKIQNKNEKKEYLNWTS